VVLHARLPRTRASRELHPRQLLSVWRVACDGCGGGEEDPSDVEAHALLGLGEQILDAVDADARDRQAVHGGRPVLLVCDAIVRASAGLRSAAVCGGAQLTSVESIALAPQWSSLAKSRALILSVISP
jgi:hypothetical protein